MYRVTIMKADFLIAMCNILKGSLPDWHASVVRVRFGAYSRSMKKFGAWVLVIYAHICMSNN